MSVKNCCQNEYWCFSNKLKSSSFMFISLFLFAFMFASPALATHTSTADLQPEWSAAGMNMDYSVEIFNSVGSDPIDEVRIFRALDYEDFDCEPKTGWELIENLTWYDSDLGGLTKMCWYYTLDSNNNILGNSSTIFEFSATVPDEGCDHKWKAETRDEESSSSGDWHIIFDYTSVDDMAPSLNKEIIGAQSGPCPPGSGEECWITQNTEIQVTITEEGECGVSGLDWCEITYTVDGGAPITETYEEFDDETNSWYYDMTFDEDSRHVLTIICKDIAGNELEDIEVFRVDDTNPVTTKEFLGPQKFLPTPNPLFNIEWIDGVTTVELTAVDPDPTHEGCNIGIDKTLYINVLAKDFDDIDELSCWKPEVHCNPIIPEPETECVMEMQDYCEGEMGYPKNSPEWITCVEQEIYDECMSSCYMGPMWKVYDGTPIEKDEESCHILQFYSIDELGNTEESNVNCFFVDKTPPVVDKDNGNVIDDTGESAFMNDDNPDGDFHWITTQMPITFTCTDQEPHPSEDEELCYKVSYDYVETTPGVYGWGHNTEDYCAAPLTADGYCCVPATPASPFEFYFQEESMHNLEYYCMDAVEKKSEVHTQYYKVDDTGPNMTKTVVGPQDGDCPPDAGDTCYIKEGVTEIVIDVDDGGEICAVGVDDCYYWYFWDGDRYPKSGTYTYDTPIIFTEDSAHELHINCVDRLGNKMGEDIETFLVDGTPPETEKTYGEPSVWDWYPKGCMPVGVASATVTGTPTQPPICGMVKAHWINSTTLITLTAEDEKVGVNETYWRNLIVTDDAQGELICGGAEFVSGITYCTPKYYSQYTAVETDWTVYTNPFNKPNESCHVIEYYSVDKFGNEELLNYQCVFVDNTPPELNKTIGDPKVIREEVVCEETNGTNITSTAVTTSNGAPATTLYVIADNAGNPNLLEAYTVEADGTLTYGMTYNIPWVSGANGAVGTALDTVNDKLFVTFEFVGDVYIFDANTFAPNGSISTPAGDLAGAFVDENQGYLYVAERQGSNIYVYDTTTNAYITTYNIGLGIYGMAFDHNNNKIYVTAYSNIVYEYDTAMNPLNTYVLPTTNVGIAVDSTNPADVYLYTTGWYGSSALTKYRINDATTSQTAINNPAGVAVHPNGGYVYVTTGYTYSLKAFDTATLTEIDNVLMPGTCTDLFVGEVVFVPYCGDSNLDANEQCDDGNLVNGDGCDDTCQIEDDCVTIETTYITNETLITLTCQDVSPHPVDHVIMSYRYRYNESCENLDSGTWTAWLNPAGNDTNPDPYIVEKTITFPEDSCHELEYYCVDGLGNMGPIKSEIDIVDSQAPIIITTVVGPQIEIDGDLYIDGVTLIHVEAYDPEPHPVNNVLCDWSYVLLDIQGVSGGNTSVTPPFDINFPEESEHELTIVCRDELNNTATVVEEYFVDKTAPITTKTYGDPEYDDGGEYPKWITSDTEIELFVEDAGAHQSGIEATYYNVTLVADENCWDQELCQEMPDAEVWDTHTDGVPFQIGEESCHMIQYFSVDNVNKTETINKQCVFVDNSAPEPVKTVGKPNELWNGMTNGMDSIYYPGLAERCNNESSDNPIDCWKVTTMTPITMECDDSEQDHPVPYKELCYMIDYDGDDITEDYCGHEINEDGWCCGDESGKELYFEEESEHNLKFYCVDALGNSNENDVDDEMFKVEGTAFNITLNKKWNLISVPLVMLNDSIDDVFADVADTVDSVWTFDGTDWFVYTPGPAVDTLTEMQPGWGYWVYSSNDSVLLIGGSLFSPATTPVTKDITYGWNLIGYWGTEGETEYDGPDGVGKPAYCELYSLGGDLFDKQFASLWTWWQPYNPSVVELSNVDNMDPGAGYWLWTAQEGEFIPTTTCGVLDLFEE